MSDSVSFSPSGVGNSPRRSFTPGAPLGKWLSTWLFLRSSCCYLSGTTTRPGVPQNPTETIVSNLKEFVRRRGLTGHITLGSCTVLEAAGDGGLPVLYKIMESSLPESLGGSSCNGKIIWLHFGANSGATKFAIERQAVNEATFRCPDELGWQPQQLPICPEDGDILLKKETTCCIDWITTFLNKKGFDVMISDDADRFVCNYVYYHSLRFAEQKCHKSLFVHVPLFSRIDEDSQMEFAATLLEALGATHPGS
ncbi:hypothetical protein H6P81_009845 [Aristolochia fimbriata]|uniref:Uncharacterized protein n=1 Tax=Aristolochia fimbriata TaxID=158543 RepID=A0AAV7EM26_ARIFI|nr:hypothetical protein H6P81_009845 [Aristolochia fimbriata]